MPTHLASGSQRGLHHVMQSYGFVLGLWVLHLKKLQEIYMLSSGNFFENIIVLQAFRSVVRESISWFRGSPFLIRGADNRTRRRVPIERRCPAHAPCADRRIHRHVHPRDRVVVRGGSVSVRQRSKCARSGRSVGSGGSLCRRSRSSFAQLDTNS